MFLRKHVREKDGKSHVYWTLVETVRTARGPRQRIVSYLGDISEDAQGGYEELAAQLNGRGQGRQRDFFEVIPKEPSISIYPQRIRVERVRDFGDVWVGVSLWKMLKFDEFFTSHLAPGREEVNWAEMICYRVVSQFCEPTSELGVAERLSQQNALCDILGIAEYQIEENRLYRTLDRLLAQKQALTHHLKERYGELFGIEYDILLYDITSTYFEGECPHNPQARYGYSRDKRRDCKQVLVAVVVTKEGMPLSFEVFDGNRRDVTTVEEMVQSIERVYGKACGIWVMDRGMVSEKVLEWLRGRGAKYLVGTPKDMLKKFEKELLEKNWQQARVDVEVKFVRCPQGNNELFVLCRSASRKEKEKAIVQRFTRRIEEGLQKLTQATNRIKRPLQNRDLLQRRIGALLKVNSRAAKLFEIQVESIQEGKKQRLVLQWKRKDSLGDWAELSSGCYLLRSNISTELSSEEMWQAYIGLTEIENVFRLSKSDLGLRPIWHHKQERVQAHIFIAFLALILQRVFEHALNRAGLGRSSRKILHEFRKIKSLDLCLPTTEGTELKLRLVSEPEQSLKIILQHCRLHIPRRLSHKTHNQFLLQNTRL